MYMYVHVCLQDVTSCLSWNCLQVNRRGERTSAILSTQTTVFSMTSPANATKCLRLTRGETTGAAVA